MIAAAVAKAANTGFRELPTTGFIEFPDPDVEFAFWELLPFSVTALCTGLCGALFCVLVERTTLMRQGFYNRRGLRRRRAYQVVEVVAIAVLTTVLIFWLPIAMGCRKINNGHMASSGSSGGIWRVGQLPNTVCKDSEYSDLGVLLLLPKETAVKALCTHSFEGGASFSIPSLLVTSGVVYVLTIVTHGAALPGGLFMPNILTGACLGRAAGHLMQDWFDADVQPGVYALIGMVGMLAGFSRMTMSVAMITLEITQSTQMLIPGVVSILVSKSVADWLKEESAYEIGVLLHPLGRIYNPKR